MKTFEITEALKKLHEKKLDDESIEAAITDEEEVALLAEVQMLKKRMNEAGSQDTNVVAIDFTNRKKLLDMPLPLAAAGQGLEQRSWYDARFIVDKDDANEEPGFIIKLNKAKETDEVLINVDPVQSDRPETIIERLKSHAGKDIKIAICIDDTVLLEAELYVEKDAKSATGEGNIMLERLPDSSSDKLSFDLIEGDE